jgi:hypothetical protein
MFVNLITIALIIQNEMEEENNDHFGYLYYAAAIIIVKVFINLNLKN